MNVALVHDYLIRFGGAERVLKELHSMYPTAPIYTLLADPAVVRENFPDADIRTSFLDRLPMVIKKRYKYTAPLLVFATEEFDLRGFDVVISSSAAFVKGVITRPETLHINYCHTPTRFLWDWTHEYTARSRGVRGWNSAMRALLHLLRLWDFEAAQRPDYIIANSKNVQGRIKKFYHRNAEVVYPPAAIGGPGPPHSRGDYFLVVSYLQAYKRVDLVVEAFTKLNLPLVVIGEGPERKHLEKLAGPSVTFLGWQPDDVVTSYMRGARAFIFPTDEDFGIAPVEAMLAGCPVLALRRGGALEYVREGATGVFFDDAHPAVLADGVRRMLDILPLFSADVIREHAEQFSRERFRREMQGWVERWYNNTQ